MEFFIQLGLLFSNMQWFVIVCICLGLALLFLEIFQPGVEIFGIIGTVLLIAAIALRAICHEPEDNVLLQTFQMILLLFIIIAGAFILFIIGNKKGWWKKSFFYQEGTAVDTVHSDGTEDFSALIGEIGTATTVLRPVGKMLFNGKTYDVVAENFLIENGKKVQVIAVEGVKITVKNID